MGAARVLLEFLFELGQGNSHNESNFESVMEDRGVNQTSASQRDRT